MLPVVKPTASLTPPPIRTTTERSGGPYLSRRHVARAFHAAAEVLFQWGRSGPPAVAPRRLVERWFGGTRILPAHARPISSTTKSVHSGAGGVMVVVFRPPLCLVSPANYSSFKRLYAVDLVLVHLFHFSDHKTQPSDTSSFVPSRFLRPLCW